MYYLPLFGIKCTKKKLASALFESVQEGRNTNFFCEKNVRNTTQCRDLLDLSNGWEDFITDRANLGLLSTV